MIEEYNNNNFETCKQFLPVQDNDIQRWLNNFPLINEVDFDTQRDGLHKIDARRYWQSGIDDVEDGNTFVEFIEYYFRLCEEWEIFE